MDYPELSLGPSNNTLLVATAKRTTTEANGTPSKKRKLQGNQAASSPSSSSLVETITIDGDQKQHSFHSDIWKQQCHDLQSGKVYYLNRNTSKKKSCSSSYLQKSPPNLDLELNFSSSSFDGRRSFDDELIKIEQSSGSNSCDNMVAMGCFKCNQLVMLSKSFPACPNCKYVHSLPVNRQTQTRKIAKSLDTLSLLN